MAAHAANARRDLQGLARRPAPGQGLQPVAQAGGRVWHVFLLLAPRTGILCKPCTIALQAAHCIGTDFKLNKAARVVAWLETLEAQRLASMEQGDEVMCAID